MDELAESDGQNQGARGTAGRALRRSRPDHAISFIRTVTVGSGIAPDLLTPASTRADAGRSRACAVACDYRRWGIAPRPENAADHEDRRVHSSEVSRAPRLGVASPCICDAIFLAIPRS